MRQFLRADTLQRSKSRVAVLVGKRIETPLFSRESKPHQFETFHIRLAVYHVTLRHIPNVRTSTLGRSIEYLQRPADGLLQSENQAKESCLASPVRTYDRYELTAA